MPHCDKDDEALKRNLEYKYKGGIEKSVPPRGLPSDDKR